MREVAEILVNHKISGVPVVEDDGRLVGIVSEGDLMSKEILPEPPAEFCILGAVIYYNGLREYKDAFDRMAANTAAALMTKKVVTRLLRVQFSRARRRTYHASCLAA